MSHRTEVTSDEEPLFTETCSVMERGNSLSHTIPSVARKLLAVSKGENVRVEIYEDGYFVTVAESDDGRE